MSNSNTNSSLGFFDSIKDGFQAGCLIVFLNLILIGLFGAGGYIAYNNYQLRTNSASTIGTVIRLEESSSASEGGTAYSPVFQYEVNGQTYEVERQYATRPPTHRVGEQETIFYDPASPEKAQIDSFMEMWLAPGLLLCFGGGGVIVTNLVALFRFFWRRRR